MTASERESLTPTRLSVLVGLMSYIALILIVILAIYT
jgi:hypothetical protein